MARDGTDQRWLSSTPVTPSRVPAIEKVQLVYFSDELETAVTPGLPVIPATPPPTTDDVATQELNRIYAEVLGRNPDSSGLATYVY